MRKGLAIYGVVLTAGALASSLANVDSNALAQSTASGAEQSKQINVVRVDRAGAAFVAVANPGESTRCTLSVLALGNVNDAFVRSELSLILAAKVSGRSISLEFTNCIVNFVNLE
jgi:hypothetical protein